MELKEMMLHRRSVRKFNDVPVSEEQIDNLLTAALSSPSGHAYYPCELIVVTDKEMLAKLEGTRAGAGKIIKDSSVTIFVLGDKIKSETWIEDCSIMLSNMHLMADAMGLGSCWIQSRCREAADGRPVDTFLKEVLGYPEQFECEACLAIGNIDEHPGAHDEEFIKSWANKIHNNVF